MRGKVAKILRGKALGKTPGRPFRSTITKIYPQVLKVDNPLTLNPKFADVKQAYFYERLRKSKRVELHPDCTRKLYKDMKRQYKRGCAV